MTESSRTWEDLDAMVSVDDALHRILERFTPLSAIQVPILDAVGMVLTDDIIAEADIPPFRNSAMDGYAVRSRDTDGAPVSLRVVGTVAAGEIAERVVTEGEAMRIMTGAAVPDGADAVVRFEETDEPQAGRPLDTIRIQRTVRAGENVREAGEDIRAGSVALSAGTHLSPSVVGLLAALNKREIAVHRRPRVAILSTGNEVVDIDATQAPGKIRDSNSYMLAAMARLYGAQPVLLGIARDSRDDLSAKLALAGDPDFFVTSGGVSVGDYDMVKDVLCSEGEIDIWQVRMKPGKPLAFGMMGAVPLLGLPGNPAAALVSFVQFGRAAILKMLGRTDVRLPEIPARLSERVLNHGRRRHFVRAVLTSTSDGFDVRPAGQQGSALLSTVVLSNCFLVVPETCAALEAGAMVKVQIPDEGIQGGEL